MLLGTGEQVVIKDVPALLNWEFTDHPVSLPDRTKPAAIWTAAARNDVTTLHIPTRYEVLAACSNGRTSDLHRGYSLPLARQALRLGQVPGKCDRDVNPIDARSVLRRRSDKCQ